MLRTRLLACAGLLAALAAGAAFAQGSTMAQDDWIQTSAISWSGGERIAAGNSKGGSAAGGEHEVEYQVVAGDSPPPRGLSSVASGGGAQKAEHEAYMNVIQNLKASTDGARDASPKLAQFAINGNSPGPCRVGQRYRALRLSDGRSRWVLTDVAVVGCAGGGMTVSYRSRQAR